MSISRKQRRAILAAHGGVCHYCGSLDAVHVDHIVPKFDGGTNDPGNLIAACLACNLFKRHRRLPPAAERRALKAAETMRAKVTELMGLPTFYISPMQSRMARAALRWSLEDLAETAGIGTNTANRFEHGEDQHARTMTKIIAAYQAEGIEFATDGETVRARVPQPIAA